MQNHLINRADIKKLIIDEFSFKDLKIVQLSKYLSVYDLELSTNYYSLELVALIFDSIHQKLKDEFKCNIDVATKYKRFENKYIARFTLSSIDDL